MRFAIQVDQHVATEERKSLYQGVWTFLFFSPMSATWYKFIGSLYWVARGETMKLATTHVSSLVKSSVKIFQVQYALLLHSQLHCKPLLC